MKHSKVALSSICAQCIPLPYWLYSYLPNIQPLLEILVIKPGNLWPSVRGIVQLENEIWFLIIKYQQMMVTGVAEGYWHIRSGPFFPGFHKMPYSPKYYVTSLLRLCALSDISAYLTRTVETETTRISNGCHSIKKVLVVMWHHIRGIALR